MPLIIRANVVDISSDTPLPTDKFLVDTNAWYWLFYPKASQQAQNYQITDYPTYLKCALVACSSLYCSPLSFSELAHNVESAEREIYAFNANRKIGAKEFRHQYPSQRQRITSLIQSMWQDVTSMSELMPTNLNTAFVDSAVNGFGGMALDGYDLFMIEQAKALGITSIITDDGDYCTVPGITVFTSNQTAIREATKANRLEQR